MNIHALIPLIATIAYIPLLVILLANRPWDRKQRLFFLFLIPATLWSFTDIFFRSDFFIQDKLLLVKVVLCAAFWMGIQWHYFLYSFYRQQRIKIPLAYAFLVSVVILAALGYIPQSIDVTTIGIYVEYGSWLMLIVFLACLILMVKDVYFLVQRFRFSLNPVEHNQFAYLLAGFFALTAFAFVSFTPYGKGVPIAHVGSLIMSCVLTYAVLRHRLLDFRVVFHRGLAFSIMGVFCIATCLSWLFFFQKVLHLELSFITIFIALLFTLAIVGFLGCRTCLSFKILSEPAIEAGTNARGSGLSTIYALAAAVDAKDHYTYGHSRKVNIYAVALAEAISLSSEEVSKISATALLHDIGKIGIPDKILNKKGRLNEEEWEAVKSHPRLGANIVGSVPALIPCISGVLYHHERWDGTGYPEGLKGDNIPLDARILAIADASDAMTSARPYRDAFCEDKVMEQLRQGAGKQFDPKLVEVFIGIVEVGLPGKVGG